MYLNVGNFKEGNLTQGFWIDTINEIEFEQVLEKKSAQTQGEQEVSPLKPDVKKTELKGLTILLAEDNPINRKLMERFLRLKGCDVIHAANGSAVLRKYDDSEVDIILMDIQMPEMDGYEAARRIRESEASSGKHVPIIALTAHALASYREKSFASGMDGYLTKPINPEEMYRIIRKFTNPS